MITIGNTNSEIPKYNNPAMALVTLACLVLTACDNSGSGKESTTQPPVTAAESPVDTSEVTAATETPAPAPTPALSESVPASAETSATTMAETAAMETGDQIAGAESQQDRVPMSGRDVYTNFCVICHRTGMNGAPKYGDKRIWKQRVAKGKETLYTNSIDGIRAMPPKGGIAWLSDQEVNDAVDFMVGGSGGWGSAK